MGLNKGDPGYAVQQNGYFKKNIRSRVGLWRGESIVLSPMPQDTDGWICIKVEGVDS